MRTNRKAPMIPPRLIARFHDGGATSRGWRSARRFAPLWLCLLRRVLLLRLAQLRRGDRHLVAVVVVDDEVVLVAERLVAAAALFPGRHSVSLDG